MGSWSRGVVWSNTPADSVGDRPPSRRVGTVTNLTTEFMFYIYVLHSKKDDKLYTGFTTDLEKRLKYHNRGLNKSTRDRRPFELIYAEMYLNEKDARKRERFLKSGRGREILREQLKHTLGSVV